MQARQQLHETQEREAAKDQQRREHEMHIRQQRVPPQREEQHNAQYNTYASHLVSPASASLTVSPTSPLSETRRPSSIPINASAQPLPPRELPKKSGILDLLDHEPAEPPRKRLRDQ